MAWLSPAYPVGAFSYSHGLEYAVEAGLVHDAETTLDWLDDVVRLGGARNDGVFLVCAHRAVGQGDRAALREVAELAAAYAPSAELALETSAQGTAFIRTTRIAWARDTFDWLIEDWPGPYAYPVAVGTAAAGHGIAADQALLAYLHTFAANLLSAAVRLVPLGQSDGQSVTAALEPVILEAASELCEATLGDVGTAAVVSDLCSMYHETQYTRLFRS
jgi:urease accessory protein